MKKAYDIHDFNGMATIDLDLNIADQLDHIRHYYRLTTGRKLRLRDAVDVLDWVKASTRHGIHNRKLAGLGLCCPYCAAAEQDLMLDPNDMTHVQCFKCNDDFTPEEARDELASLLAPWQAYLALMERAAAKPAEPLPVAIAARAGNGVLCECGA